MSAHKKHELIAGRFQLERRLGAGGMGEVWRATHLVTHKTVALKFLKPEVAAKATATQRFVREARATSAVRHPNVVQVHDFLELDDGSPVMVMDALEGESLAARLEREGVLSLAEAATTLVPVISAVGHAHAEGIIHRDLKPANIFLEQGPADTVVPRVLDFGIAKLKGSRSEPLAFSGLTETGELLGTPHYMAPEQAFGETDIDHRVDVWALGVILYQCLAGKLPINASNLGQLYHALIVGTVVPLGSVVPGVPDDVLELVKRMLAKERADRLADLRDALTVLSRHTHAPALPFDAPRRSCFSIDELPAPIGDDAESVRSVADPTVDVSRHGQVDRTATSDELEGPPHSTTAAGTLARSVSPQQAAVHSKPVPRRRSRAAAIAIALTLVGLGMAGVTRSVEWSPASAPPVSSGALSAASALSEPMLTPSTLPASSTVNAVDEDRSFSAATVLYDSATRKVQPVPSVTGSTAKPADHPAPTSPDPAISGSTRLPGGVVKALPF